MIEDDTVNITGLDKLLKALKDTKPPRARVGILSDKTHFAQLKPGEKQPKHVPTNPEVGAVHEFGAPDKGIPQRSFLRVPLTDHLEEEMISTGLLGNDEMQAVLKEGSVLPWVKKIAILAEGIVAKAFASGGFGKWPSWKTKGYTNNANMLLVDTAQLRGSITSEVK